ncbi:hypothetical protein AB0929_08220 [Streptomyces massasporeus]|uniref:hypothetical protein n=1 Tax=Streptomyces massasporeus TaxID=67324 RepID=UPI0034527CEC
MRLWHLKLKLELERIDRRKRRMGDVSQEILERWKAEELETKSLYDLISRGLDPAKTRAFRGRISVTVRCAVKGHVLARVYATRYLPVLVPQTPYRAIIRDKEKRFAELPRDKEFRSAFPHVQFRDAWIDVWTDDDLIDSSIDYEKVALGVDRLPRHRIEEIELKGSEFDIPGLTVIQERHAATEVEYEGTVYQPSWYLLCRCGLRYLATHLVVEALSTRTSKIFA